MFGKILLFASSFGLNLFGLGVKKKKKGSKNIYKTNVVVF
jgi:hypothetical protein